jgi:hypothetical protein
MIVARFTTCTLTLCFKAAIGHPCKLCCRYEEYPKVSSHGNSPPELELKYKTVSDLSHKGQANIEREQTKTALSDSHSEPDEIFEHHLDRKRSNKKHGHGTYDNDRSPVVGIVGGKAGKCGCARFTPQIEKRPGTSPSGYAKNMTCYTDEWQTCNLIMREYEWARDDDGIREVHLNTIEGCGRMSETTRVLSKVFNRIL